MTTGEQVARAVTGPPPQSRVMELITSLWKTHVTAAIARLGVPDHLAGGPRTAADLAAAVPADAGAMARLLRAGRAWACSKPFRLTVTRLPHWGNAW